MLKLISAAIGCVVFVAMTSVADAQIRVGRFGGGVSLRVPFVSVDVLPYGGGTRVRAPFTSVNTGLYRYGGYGYGGYGYGGYGYGDFGYAGYGYRGMNGYDPYARVPLYRSVPVYPAPAYAAPVYPESRYVPPRPNDYQAARPASSGSLKEQLRGSAQQLIRSLSVRRDDGDIWLDYLGPQRIVETIDRGEPADSLRDLLTNYDGVVGNASLSSIRRARGFRETHQGLRAFMDSTLAESAPVEAAASDAGEIPVPAEPGTTEPTPAQPIKPAKEDKKEELPIPTPL